MGGRGAGRQEEGERDRRDEGRRKNANAFNGIDLHYFTVRVRVGSSLDLLFLLFIPSSSGFFFSLF